MDGTLIFDCCSCVIALLHVLSPLYGTYIHVNGVNIFPEVLNDSVFGHILSLIGTVVHHDQRGTLNMKTQKCFLIKEGISGKLAYKIGSCFILELKNTITSKIFHV